MPSTSSRSCARSGRGFRRSVASTTPKSRFRNWPTSSSSAFSIRRACARIWSSSSSAPAIEARAVSAEQSTYEFDARHAVRQHRGAPPRHPQAAQPHPEAVLQPEPARPGAAPADRDQPLYEQTVRPGARRPRGRRHALLRARPQPRARADARRHRDQNLKMRLESLVEPDGLRRTRRARALESVVQYRPEAGPSREPPPPRPRPAQDRRRRSVRATAGVLRRPRRREPSAADGRGPGESTARRRRRRRRGRRGRAWAPARALGARGVATDAGRRRWRPTASTR